MGQCRQGGQISDGIVPFLIKKKCLNQPSHPLSIWRLKTEFVLHLVRKCLLSITYFRGYLLSHNSNRTGSIFCRQNSVFF